MSPEEELEPLLEALRALRRRPLDVERIAAPLSGALEFTHGRRAVFLLRALDACGP